MPVIIRSNADQLLNTLVGNGPAAPFTLGLMTQSGSEGYPGAEVSGGGYTRKSVLFATNAQGGIFNWTSVLFSAMPACVVAGYTIYDSQSRPVLWIDSGAGITVGTNETFTLSAGALVVYELAPGEYRATASGAISSLVSLSYDGMLL